jgi:hypothetical protein
MSVLLHARQQLYKLPTHTLTKIFCQAIPTFFAGKGRVTSARQLDRCNPNVGTTVTGGGTIRTAALDAGYHIGYT